MSLITKNNYEAFLLDYVEGNLSPEHTAELMLFFENNPELKEDLEGFDMFTLTPPDVALTSKEELKISEDQGAAFDIEEAMIGEVEGVNTPEKSFALKQFLQENPAKQKEFDLYQKTVLSAPQIIADFKDDLKQDDDKVIPLYWWYTSAAAVILVIFLLNINWNNNEPVNNGFANDANPTEKEEIKSENNQVEDEIEAPLIAVEEVVKEEEASVPDEKQNLPERIKKEKKQKQSSIKDDKIEEVILANDLPDEKIKDSIINTPSPKEEILEEEEVLYADDVKIIYEEEQVPENVGTPKKSKKYTKLDAVRASIKQQVRDKFLNKVKDESALAMSSGPLSLLRGKNKNK